MSEIEQDNVSEEMEPLESLEKILKKYEMYRREYPRYVYNNTVSDEQAEDIAKTCAEELVHKWWEDVYQHLGENSCQEHVINVANTRTARGFIDIREILRKVIHEHAIKAELNMEFDAVLWVKIINEVEARREDFRLKINDTVMLEILCVTCEEYGYTFLGRNDF
jgi:hypothetical protein